MENKTQGPEELFQKAREYAEIQISLLKLRGVNKVAGSMGSIMSVFVLAGIFGGILLCFTVGLSLLIGKWIGSVSGGFFIIGGVYLLAGIVIYVMREKLIRGKVTDRLIKELLN